MRWKKIVMRGFQSWQSNTPCMDLNPCGLNVIYAENETGKSVFGKALKTCCFPRSGKFEIKDLISDNGHGDARLMIEIEDGRNICFILSPKIITYACLDKDGNIYKEKGLTYRWDFSLSDPKAEIPDELVELLSLVIDRQGQLVINIMEKSEQLFVTTSSEVNARAIAPVLEDPETVNIKALVDSYFERVKSAINVARRDTTNAAKELRLHPYVDVTENSILLNRSTALMRVFETNHKLGNYLSSDKINKIYNFYLNSMEIPPKETLEQMELLYQMLKLDFSCLNKIDISFLDHPVEANPNIEIFMQYNSLMDTCREYLNTHSIKELPSIKEDNDILSLGNLLTSFDNLGEYIGSMKVTTIDTEVEDISSKLEEVFNCYNITLSIKDTLTSLENTLKKAIDVAITYKKLNKEFKEFKTQIGECPLCGNRLEV